MFESWLYFQRISTAIYTVPQYDQNNLILQEFQVFSKSIFQNHHQVKHYLYSQEISGCSLVCQVK